MRNDDELLQGQGQLELLANGKGDPQAKPVDPLAKSCSETIVVLQSGVVVGRGPWTAALKHDLREPPNNTSCSPCGTKGSCVPRGRSSLLSAVRCLTTKLLEKRWQNGVMTLIRLAMTGVTDDGSGTSRVSLNPRTILL